MTKPPSVRRAFLHQVLSTTEQQGDRVLKSAEDDRVLGDPDWPLVRQLTHLDTAALLRKYKSKINLSSELLPHLDLGAHTMDALGSEGEGKRHMHKIGPGKQGPGCR